MTGQVSNRSMYFEFNSKQLQSSFVPRLPSLKWHSNFLCLQETVHIPLSCTEGTFQSVQSATNPAFPEPLQCQNFTPLHVSIALPSSSLGPKYLTLSETIPNSDARGEMRILLQISTVGSGYLFTYLSGYNIVSTPKVNSISKGNLTGSAKHTNWLVVM